MVIGAHRIPR